MKTKIVLELKKRLGFLHSSGVVAAQEQANEKILTAALKVDQDYRRYRFVEAWPTCR